LFLDNKTLCDAMFSIIAGTRYQDCGTAPHRNTTSTLSVNDELILLPEEFTGVSVVYHAT
jgi:hypothetical protein